MISRPPKPTPRRAKASAPATEIDAQSYIAFVGDLKQKIVAARHRAGLSVNRELIVLYWTIGRDILVRQEREGWGAKVIDRLSDDLRQAFPEMTGLSARNLKYMRAFAEAWPDGDFVQQLAAQLPWGHNSGSQSSIGIGVVGGMLSATVLGIFFIPLLFYCVRRTLSRTTDSVPAKVADEEASKGGMA